MIKLDVESNMLVRYVAPVGNSYSTLTSTCTSSPLLTSAREVISIILTPSPPGTPEVMVSVKGHSSHSS